MKKYVSIVSAGLFFLMCLGSEAVAQDKHYDGLMGFTPWPYDLTTQAVIDTYRFIHENGNMISHHLDNGVPWDAALNDDDLPQTIINDWSGRLERTDDEMKILLSMTPLNIMRDGLALGWTVEGDNRPLAPKWKNKKLSDPAVIKAYTNYVLRGVEFFKPDFLAIGIEANILVSLAPEKWDDYLSLNRQVYVAVKEKYPDLPIFSTVQYEHYRGIENVSKNNLAKQKPGVAALMKHSDMLVLSTYKYGFVHPNEIRDDYFDELLEYNKPMAIAETGAMSKTTIVMGLPLISSETNQKEFVRMILEQAAEHDFVFVIHWLTMDFDKMLPKFPKEYRSLAKAWVHSGLLDQNKKKKPAYRVWREHFEE